MYDISMGFMLNQHFTLTRRRRKSITFFKKETLNFINPKILLNGEFFVVTSSGRLITNQ